VKTEFKLINLTFKEIKNFKNLNVTMLSIMKETDKKKKKAKIDNKDTKECDFC
jgi:hypothetical protein